MNLNSPRAFAIIISNLAYIFAALQTEEDEKRFLVVSSSELAAEFWPKLQRPGSVPPSGQIMFAYGRVDPARNPQKRVRAMKRSHFIAVLTEELLSADPSITIERKRQICEDITNDYYLFGQHKEYPYEKNVPSMVRRMKPFHYLTKKQQVSSSVHGVKFPEIVYTCKTWCTTLRNTRYYISEEYNLTSESSLPGDHFIARFIFIKVSRTVKYLYGLAELPGIASHGTDHDVERLYLERRGKYTVSRTKKEDALCKLGNENKKRVCRTVLTSEYFEGKFKFSTAYEITSGPCALERVSFQTEYGKDRATERRFREWMLTCAFKTADDLEYSLSLSHAYMSHQIFVYVRKGATEELFPENLITNVRLTFVSDGQLWYPGTTEDELPRVKGL